MKLLVSSAPHITGKDTTASLMRDLIIAMVPAMAASVFFFGVQSLILTAVSVLACVGFEFLYEKMLKTALEEPERLSEIGYLLQMITQKDIIPDEFRELYETFKKTLRLK